MIPVDWDQKRGGELAEAERNGQKCNTFLKVWDTYKNQCKSLSEHRKKRIFPLGNLSLFIRGK